MASVVDGRSAEEFSAGETVIAGLAHWSAETPDAPAYTFFDFAGTASGTEHTLTWAQTARRVSALAATLGRRIGPGERAAILAPQGIDYVIAMLAALRTSAIAVPLFTPDLPGHGDRLRAILADCTPTHVLTTTGAQAGVERFLGAQAETSVKEIIAVDAVGEQGGDPGPLAAGPDDPAYLQYTSGSTRQPAGVVITHRNLSANVRQLWSAAEARAGTTTTVNWLPLFHDMGLVLTVAVPLLEGCQTVFMDPAAFLMRPASWLRLLGTYPGAYGAAPNFAYEHCVKRVSADDKACLDLSGVRGLMNGAEPVRQETMTRFTEAFAECGLAPNALTTAYGLAEATVYVSVGARDAPPRGRRVDRDALSRGELVDAGAGHGGHEVSTLVGCGTPVGQLVAVVEAESSTPLPERRVGELWVRGPNVAAAYWGSTARGAEVFGATLAGSAGEAALAGDGGADGGTDGWLRTGDLGAFIDGELYVTGRAKDLIIVDGRNHYPQDIEATAQEAGPAIRKGRIAAFALPGDDGERLVIAAETDPRATPEEADPQVAAGQVRQAVHREHGLHLDDLWLVERDGVRRTSSGKIARRACRDAYLRAHER